MPKRPLGVYKRGSARSVDWNRSQSADPRRPVSPIPTRQEPGARDDPHLRAARHRGDVTRRHRNLGLDQRVGTAAGARPRCDRGPQQLGVAAASPAAARCRRRSGWSRCWQPVSAGGARDLLPRDRRPFRRGACRGESPAHVAGAGPGRQAGGGVVGQPGGRVRVHRRHGA